MDRDLLVAINAWTASPVVAFIAIAFSSRWLLVLVPFPLFAFLAKHRRFVAMGIIAVTMGLGDLTSVRMLKPFFERVRPCRAIPGVLMPDGCGVGESFPSAHAAVAFAFLFVAAPVVPRGWWFLTPLAAGIAFSRVALGVHYPSDIIAGAILGALIGYAGHRLRRKLEKEVRKEEQLPPARDPDAGPELHD